MKADTSWMTAYPEAIFLARPLVMEFQGNQPHLCKFKLPGSPVEDISPRGGAIAGENSPSHPRTEVGVMGISRQESGTIRGRVLSSCVRRLDYRTLIDFTLPNPANPFQDETVLKVIVDCC